MRLQRRALLVAAFSPGLAFAQSTGGRDHELQHAAATLSYGAASLETSRLALSKANHPGARRFAGFEVAEQETLAAVLESIGGDRNGIAPQRQPKIEDKAQLDRLRTLSSGFDQAYVHGQIAGHRQLLQLQETYLSQGQDPAFKAVAALARGHIKEHLEMLESLKRDVG
jgi:putative membrane protein